MQLTVQRTNYDDQCTQGELSIDGVFFCYTLEPRKDQSRGKPYAVPAGTYPITLGDSEHFSMTVPMVGDVPGFTGVEIHPGNFPSDTHGCCLVGETSGTDFVGQSRAAFETLMRRLAGSGDTQHTITYIG